MVRAPAKSCPNLSRLFDNAEPAMISAFLRMPVFEKLTWLVDYRFEPDGDDGDVTVAAMLRELASRLQLGEIVINTWAHDPAVRRRSYTLIAQAMRGG